MEFGQFKADNNMAYNGIWEWFLHSTITICRWSQILFSYPQQLSELGFVRAIAPFIAMAYITTSFDEVGRGLRNEVLLFFSLL